jgi:putative membrane protein
MTLGREIENPFGDDVNDLPLDAFCGQIRQDIDLIMSKPAPTVDQFIMNDANEMLYPMSGLGGRAWAEKSVEEIREALGQKPGVRYRHTEPEDREVVQASDHV